MAAYALIGTGSITAAWYVIVLFYAAATRARDLTPAPATMTIGTEPPAVVNLLVTRCELTPAAAVATLLDLAARHMLELHQPGRDPADVLIRVRVTDPAGLASYERRVLDRFTAFAGDRLVPLRDAAAHHVNGGPLWFRHLRAEVVRDAQGRGLVRDRKPGSPLVLLAIVVAIAIACAGSVPWIRTGDSAATNTLNTGVLVGAMCTVPITVLLLIFIALFHLRAPRHTATGKRAGSEWLGLAGWLAAHEDLASLPPAAVTVWDRYLAYGVALGVNPLAEQSIDMRVGHISRYTSRYTGTPRVVVIRYPRDPFAYTQAGVRALWSALTLLACAGGWALASHARTWPRVPRVATMLVLVAFTVRATYKLIRSVYVKLTPLTVTGQVLATHPWWPRRDGSGFWTQIIIDDGVATRTRPWLVRADRAIDVRPGQLISIRAQRWTRYVLRLDIGPSVQTRRR